MSHTDEEKWNKIIVEIKKEIPNFKIVKKSESRLSKIISKILFWTKFNNFWTTIYPNVYIPETTEKNTRILQHEWVHLKDQKTFFGLMPKVPAKINTGLFGAIYLMPQVFAALALLALWSPWWLLCLLFVLPLPAPGRAISELRAYRRSRELSPYSSPEERYLKQFVGKNYYFMLPFKKLVLKSLKKESPYKDQMDAVITED